MENKVIDDKADDGSWIVISGGGYRRLAVDPAHKQLVNKWHLGDPVIIEINKNLPPYNKRVYNTTE